MKEKIIVLTPIILMILCVCLGVWWFINVRFASCEKMVEQGIYGNIYTCLLDKNN